MMPNNRNSLTVIVLCVTALLSGCLTAGSDTLPQARIQALMNDACFEVVIARTDADSLTYEKALPWDLLPYDTRNDSYVSIGTAFAVSPTEFVTAAHVLELLNDSRFYREYGIRDSEKNVYPIGSVTAFDIERDFAKFTAPGARVGRHLKLNESYVLNSRVYAVGNIYGQGLVAVPATLLGTVPEQENGRWLLLKNAPANDKGSSGGPLLDENFNVIGIILSKDDNFSYSLPVGEFAGAPANLGKVSVKFHYLFALLPGLKSDPVMFEHTLELPLPLAEAKRRLSEAYLDHYVKSMNEFIEAADTGLFPEGEGARDALQDACNSTSIQFVYRNDDDGKWYFSNLKKSSSKLENRGLVLYAAIDGTLYIDLVKPTDVTHGELYGSPDRAMNLILKGINIPRKFAGQDIRVLSLGAPAETRSHRDAYERLWRVAIWNVEYSDTAAILLYTPTPDGLVGVFRFCESGTLEQWMYDLTRTLDFVCIPYYGKLSDWSEFLAQKEYISGIFPRTVLEYSEEKGVKLETDEFSFTLPKADFPINGTSVLSLLHDFFPDPSGRAVWDVRKIVFSESGKDNYTVYYRFLDPPDGVHVSFSRNWNTLVNGQYPYNGTAFANEGRTDIGSVHPRYRTGSTNAWSVYLGREGTRDPAEMKTLLETFRNAMRFK